MLNTMMQWCNHVIMKWNFNPPVEKLVEEVKIWTNEAVLPQKLRTDNPMMFDPKRKRNVDTNNFLWSNWEALECRRDNLRRRRRRDEIRWRRDENRRRRRRRRN